MQLRCPIQRFYLNNAYTCVINQLYGENPNAFFYGPEGHTGIDFKTTGQVKFLRHFGDWKVERREGFEVIGRIPIVACHDGTLVTSLHDDKKGYGWGIYVVAEPEESAGVEVQYRTLYWHIETPWSSLASFAGAVNKTLRRIKVRAGAIIAIGGNNGKSTGPHLHLSLHKRSKVGGQWTSWYRINPMSFFNDSDILYQRYYGFGDNSDWFYEGQKIDRARVEEIKAKLPNVIN